MAVNEDEARYLLCCEPDLLVYIESSNLGPGSIPSSHALPESRYRKKCGFGLESTSDASFAPGGGHSHGAVITLLGGSPIAWKFSKRPFPALSTAEAELIEVIESVILGDSVSCLVEEMAGNMTKVLKCDNTAAIALGSSATGAWRTRHLKVRAAHLRWKLEAGSWDLKYEPGKDLVADIGTKVLAPTRMQNLMRNMEMGWQPKGGDRQEDEPEEDLPVVNRLWLENDFKKVAQLVTVITMFQKIDGALATQNDTKNESRNDEGSEVLYMFGVIVMILGMVLMKILQRCHMRWNRPREDPTMRSMRVTADGATSNTRPTTRSIGERGGRSDTVQGRQNHGRHCDGSTSRSSLSSTRGNQIRSAEQYDSGTQGTQGVRGDDHLDQQEPHEEPPN